MYAATAKDPRFTVVAHPTRLGHYGNFERVLAAVPPDADFVALADQDDVWYPEKLTRTLAAFRPETTLVYADMDVVAPDGTRLAPTYWTTRRNNFTDLASLVFANTVTGAASVFRAELLADVLPFPPRIGDAYHDHWIGCVALTRGSLGYVDASAARVPPASEQRLRPSGAAATARAADPSPKYGEPSRVPIRPVRSWPSSGAGARSTATTSSA